MELSHIQILNKFLLEKKHIQESCQYLSKQEVEFIDYKNIKIIKKYSYWFYLGYLIRNIEGCRFDLEEEEQNENIFSYVENEDDYFNDFEIMLDGGFTPEGVEFIENEQLDILRLNFIIDEFNDWGNLKHIKNDYHEEYDIEDIENYKEEIEKLKIKQKIKGF